jgi:hypothetical protein
LSEAQSTNPKDRIGRMKPPLELIPPTASILEAMVFKLGAQKYGAYNWRANKVAASVYIGACLRHLAAWYDGQDNDPESDLPHPTHARACLAILLDAMMTGNLVDDRPPHGVAAELIGRFTNAATAKMSPSFHAYYADELTTVPLDSAWQPAIPPGSNFHDPSVDGVHDYEVAEAQRIAGEHRRDELIADVLLGADGSGGTMRRELKPRQKVDLLTLLYLGAPNDVADQILGGMAYGPPIDPSLPRAVAYVAGPMRGLPAFNFPAFDAARDALLTGGWDVISPADIDRFAGDENCGDQDKFSIRDFFAIRFVAAMRRKGSAAIVMLPGWELSTGASAELFLARWLGVPILDSRTLAPLAPSSVNSIQLIGALRQHLMNQLAK